MTVSTISQNTGATYSGVTDAWLRELSPTTNISASSIPEVTSYVSGDRSHWLLKFGGLSNIASSQVVSGAVLKLYTQKVVTSVDIELMRCIVDWVNTQATWNVRQTATNWTTAGARGASDVNLTVLATATLTTNGIVYSFSGSGLTTLVQGWIDGSIANQGMLLVRNSDVAYDMRYVRFAGVGDTTNGPVLEVTHSAGGPTVTSVTQTSGGTEGSPAVMTVALSGATSGSTNFAATLAGVTATGSGTDFTSDLASATYSNGVTFSGGNMVVPDAVSGWTVTIATTSDTLDEANETATLTVGGTAGTLTITDDDTAPTLTGTASSTVTAGSPVVITYNPGLSGQTRTYTLALTDGTATGGTDYDNTTVTGDFAVTAGTGSVSISGSTVTVDAGVTEFTLSIGTTA